MLDVILPSHDEIYFRSKMERSQSAILADPAHHMIDETPIYLQFTSKFEAEIRKSVWWWWWIFFWWRVGGNPSLHPYRLARA